ncbi:MAG TPA: ankyrin repeat domain-containing protein, partial [Nevskiaceae bacterium]|nr:ankyrin repeat domain-containing protein [Nevskiaceae bacterium]
QGRTPLMYAALSRYGDRSLEALIHHSAKINAYDTGGKTALQLIPTQLKGPPAERHYAMLYAAGAR